MNSHLETRFLLSGLLVGFSSMLAVQLQAQTFTTLHSFSKATGYTTYASPTNTDGVNPLGGLVLSGNTLYGTTVTGGSSALGTVFKINTDGTGFSSLHSFSGSDGINPYAGLILKGNTLYGTTVQGGNSQPGTIFAVNTDGTGFTNLYSFESYAEGYPHTGLTLSGNILYGTATGAGGSFGTVFAINTDGTDFENLYIFGGGDGISPYAGLMFSDETLYGTAVGGGDSGLGTVFSLKTDGTGFTNVYSFTGGNYGKAPYAELVLSGNTLYSTTMHDGVSGYGTVFAVNTDGSVFRTLHSFTGVSDGGKSGAGLVLSGNVLYGTAQLGGSSQAGTVFAVNTNGTGFTILHSFAGHPSEGSVPLGRLILSGNTLYGTTSQGGSSDNGTVFSISLAVSQPRLTVIPSTTNLIFAWPTNAIGFTLQSTTNLGSSAVWTPVSQAPIIANGQNTMSNPIIPGTQQFFRLSQ